jgi:hypothetical protein
MRWQRLTITATLAVLLAYTLLWMISGDTAGAPMSPTTTGGGPWAP